MEFNITQGWWLIVFPLVWILPSEAGWVWHFMACEYNWGSLACPLCILPSRLPFLFCVVSLNKSSCPEISEYKGEPVEQLALMGSASWLVMTDTSVLKWRLGLQPRNVWQWITCINGSFSLRLNTDYVFSANAWKAVVPTVIVSGSAGRFLWGFLLLCRTQVYFDRTPIVHIAIELLEVEPGLWLHCVILEWFFIVWDLWTGWAGYPLQLNCNIIVYFCYSAFEERDPSMHL